VIAPLVLLRLLAARTVAPRGVTHARIVAPRGVTHAARKDAS